jgi:hypothetical protein
MITTGSSSLELKFDVRISGAFIDFTSIQRVSIELQENMHNMAVLDVAGIPPQELTNYIDIPIEILVGVGAARFYRFVGYISYLEPVSVNKDGLINNSPFQTTRMYCFGASYVMRSRRTTSWENKTLPQIAKELAKKYSFTLSVPNDTYVFPRLAQAGKSDWELLVHAANYLGYSVMMRGVHIDIWDPFASFSRMGVTPIYAMSANKGGVSAYPGQVLKFHGVIGAVTPTSARVPDTVHALINGSVDTFTRSDSTGYGAAVESIFTDEVAKNADSTDMVTALLHGRSREKLPYTAMVDVVGDPSIEPGMVVELEKYDSSVDGFWIVQAVRHEMVRGSALSYLTLAKDSNKSVNFAITAQAPPLGKLPLLTLKNSRWVTTRELNYVY